MCDSSLLERSMPQFNLDSNMLGSPIYSRRKDVVRIYEDACPRSESDTPSSSGSGLLSCQSASLPTTPLTSPIFDAEGISFPLYENDEGSDTDRDEHIESVGLMPSTPAKTFQGLIERPEDDTAAIVQPANHVDYLSHQWNEEDIWSTWKHIVSKRKVYSNSARLENASWRTWEKTRSNLKTVSPETVKWLKDHDVTWLYGPLQPGFSVLDRTRRTDGGARRRGISNANRGLHKKPILKKRSLSELMLRRSVSSASLLKRAAWAVNAQKSQEVTTPACSSFLAATPGLTRTNTTLPSYSGSGINSPSTNSWKNVRFHDLVEQCVALAQGDEHGEQNTSEDDDDVVLMRRMPKRIPKPSRPRIKLETNTSPSRTIEKLPNAPLKSPEDETDSHGLGIFHCPPLDSKLSARVSTSVFLEGSDDEEDEHWKPPKWGHNRKDSVHLLHDKLDAIKRNIGTSPTSESLLRDSPLVRSPLDSPDSERSPITFKLAAFSFTSMSNPAQSSSSGSSTPDEEAAQPTISSWSAPVDPIATDYFGPILTHSYTAGDDDDDDYDWIESYAPRDATDVIPSPSLQGQQDTQNSPIAPQNDTTITAPRSSSDSGYASSEAPACPDTLNQVRDTYRGVEMEKERAMTEWDLYPGAWADLELEEAVAWSRGF